MVDQDITQTLETITTKPNEAIENIAQASKEGSNPDSYAQSNGGVDPSKKVQTTMVDRKLASEMQDSSQVASAVSLDVTKMDWGAKMGSYAGLSIRQSDAGRERARLANQVRELRRSGKPVPEDLEWDLAAWRDEANSISADIDKLQLGDISEGVASIPTFLTDQFKDMWKQKELVAGSTAAGSAAGGLFGSMTIPLVGTFAGWAGGGAAGFVVGSMAASARENYNRMAGEVYDELSIATKPNGSPLNLPESEKDAIASGVGFATSGIELIADKIGVDRIPILKKFLSPKFIREAVSDPAKMQVLKSFGNLAKNVTAAGLTEGSTEAVQEYVQMLGDELGQTWDGKETSLSLALSNLNKKVATDKKTQERLKSAATIGAVAGAAVTGVAGAIPAGREAVATPTTPMAPQPQAMVEKQPSDFIQIENGVPLSMSPQKSVNLAVALKGISDATVDTALGKKTPVDAEAIQARMLKESGINEVWVASEDLNKWSNTQEKADYIRRTLTPNQIKDLEMGASVAIDPATILEMIRQDDTAARFVRPSADGMSFNEVIKAYETGSQRAQEFLQQQGVAQATEAPMVDTQEVSAPLEQAEMPPTAGLGPSSTDEEIVATLGTRQEANAYLDRLVDEESRLVESNISPENVKGETLFHGSRNIEFDPTNWDKPFIWTYNNTSMVNQYGGRTIEMVLDSSANIVNDETIPNDFSLDNPTQKFLQYLKDNNIDAVLRHEVDGKRQIVVVNKDKVFLKNQDGSYSRIKNQERLTQVQAMRDRVQALTEQLPDQPTARPEGGADLSEQEIADAAFESYMQQPLMTDLVRAGVPKEALVAFESEYNRIRSEIVAATQEAADKEMGQVKDQLVDLAQLEAEIEANTRAVNDPNVAMVELFLANRKELAIDPDTLSVEQKIKYIDDGVLVARKAFKKGGIDPETLAIRLGLESGDAVLQMLATTPDRKRTVENAMNFTKEQLSLEAADKIEISSASILKVLTDKQKMNLKEFKHFVETSWVKARNGIEGIIFSNINLDTIREETKTKVQQTKLSALSPKAYERASKLATKRKVKSGLRGDTLESARQREIEIRADEFLKQTYETIGKANRAIKQINRMMRNPSVQESLRKAGMQDAFIDFAAIINLGDQRGKSDVGAYERLQAKLVSEQTADISIPQELINTFDPRATLKNLSYEQVDFIRNKMKELVKLAEEKNTFREGQEKKSFDTIKDVVIQDIKASPYYDQGRVGTEGEFDAGVMDAVTSKFDLIDASMTNIQYIMTQISPDDTSPIHQLIVDQLFGVGNYKNSGYGYAAYNKIKGQIQKRINEHLNKYGRKRIETYGYTWVDAPELAGSQYLLNKNGRILKSQLLAAVGLYGSETGRQRLSNYGVDPEIILQVAEKHLTPEDFDFNQEAIHDTFELMRPEIERVFRDLGKEPPDFIQGLGYTAHGKTYRGGYVNIRYRDDVSVDAANKGDQQKVKELTGEAKTRPIEPESLKDMTYQGQYESRVETYEGIPSLDFATNIAIGIENVVTDVAMNVPIKEVMKLLTDKDISQEMIRVVGTKKHSILKNHVMSAGKSLTSDQLALFKDVESEWQSMFDSIGNKVIAGTLLGLPSSIVAQFSSGVFMWHTLGIRSTGTYLGVWSKMILNPKVNMRQMVEWAGKIDPSIGQYAQNIDERTFGEIYNILPKRRSDYKVTRWIETGSTALSNVYFKTAMSTIDTMMKTSAIATAYSRFLSGKTPGYDVKTLAKLSDAEKIRLAESYAFNQVNRTGTSTTILDRAYFQKSTVFKGYANYFNDARNIYNYSMTYATRPIKNNIKDIVSDMKSGDVGSATRKSFDIGYRLATLQLATAVAATIINMARGRDTEGEEMPEIFTLSWETKMLENLFKNIINPFSVTNVILAGPAILRDVIYSVDTAIESEGRYVNQVAPVHVKAINNIVSGIYALNQLVTNLELTEQEQKMLLKGVGSIVPNIPFNAAGKIISSEGSRSTVDAIAADPGILIGATAYVAWVIQQAISKGDFGTANAAREIERTLINPKGALNVKDLMSDQVKALTPEEIGIIGYTESSGMQSAVSKIGATGLYQFTEETWENLMFTYPELRLTYAGRSAKDTTEQEIAMDRLVRDNAVTLLQNNVEISLNSVYAAHHFGSGRISRLWNLEDNNRSVEEILGKGAKKNDAYKSNPWLRGEVSWINNGRPVKTVADFKRGIQDLLNRGRDLYNEEVMKDFNLD